MTTWCYMRGRSNKLLTPLLLLGIFFWVATLQVRTQTPLNIDEIVERLSQADSDADLEKLLSKHLDWNSSQVAAGALKIAQQRLSVDFNKSLSCARVALHLSSKLNDKQLKVRSLYLLALGDL